MKKQTNYVELPRHNGALHGLEMSLRLIGLGTSKTTVLMAARRRLESGDIDPNDVSKKQPDLEIFAFHLGGNLRTLLDITVTDPTALSHNNLPEGVGKAAASRERMKVNKYADQASAAGYRFLPFGLEVYGAWGPAAIAALDEFCEYAVLAGRMDTRSSVGWDAPHFSEVCRQWVSFGLQRENARLLINGASRRQSRVRDNQFRDMALHGDGIADDEDVADPRLLLEPHNRGRIDSLRDGTVIARSIVAASDATRHNAALDAEAQPSQNEQEAVAARVSAAEVDATGRRRQSAIDSALPSTGVLGHPSLPADPPHLPLQRPPQAPSNGTTDSVDADGFPDALPF